MVLQGIKDTTQRTSDVYILLYVNESKTIKKML